MKKAARGVRIPAVLNLKRMAWAFAGVLASLILVATTHHFAGDSTKAKIESGTLAVIDIVRENRATPPEVVFWLDLAADAMPMMHGRGVPVAANEFGDTSAAPGGIPAAARPLLVLRNTGYTVGYDETRKTPAWAVYRVDKPDNTLGPRPDGFAADNRTRARVKPSAYSHSGYDRGHLAPNHAIGVCYGEKAQRETFLMSNIVPQLHALNDGLWREIEQRIIRRYPARFKEAWITCGPVYDHTDRPKTLRDGVWVPDAFFLVVSHREESTGTLHAQAYLIPHDKIRDTADPSEYLTEVRAIETRTGLDLFPTLPREKQQGLETAKALKAW